MNRWFRVVITEIVLASLLAMPSTLYAGPLLPQRQMLLETGSLGPIGQRSGAAVYNEQFLGVRFEITQTVTTETVGGHFRGLDGSFFAAIVALDQETDFPDSVNLSTPDVLGTTLLAAPFLSDEVTSRLSLTLRPGWYALMFGSGLFGATGEAAATQNNPPIGSHSYFFWSQGNGIYLDSDFGRVRFFLTGRPGDYNSPPPIGAITHVSTFAAQAEEASVMLTWQTVQEVNLTGFHLYRAASDSIAFRRLTETPLPARGNGESGATYHYVDRPGPGHYVYKLASVASGGGEILHAQAEAAVGRRLLFVPMLQR